MLRIDQLRQDIKKLSQYAVETRQRTTEEVETALRWWEHAPPSDALREKLLPFITSASGWQGALPTTPAPLTHRFNAPSSPPPGTTVVAVDGSQIYPDRHAAFLYYLIQIGALIFRYNGQAPTPTSKAWLYFEEQDLHTQEGYLISAQHLSVQRTLKEIDYLAEQIEIVQNDNASPPLLALSDGPLLWTLREPDREHTAALDRYLHALTRIRQAGGMPVGFIERPSGRLFVDLLWAGQIPQADLSMKLETNPLLMLTDEMLMRYVLKPGERTVWLERPSSTNDAYARQGHAIWCCYLNVGTEPGHPIIARVEVPVWGAQNEPWITTLHSTLRHQIQVLEGTPYVLARAHEIALVTAQDKAALDAMLQRQLWQKGVPARISEKARQKSYLGRRRRSD
jgi:hypothetical protein